MSCNVYNKSISKNINSFNSVHLGIRRPILCFHFYTKCFNFLREFKKRKQEFLFVLFFIYYQSMLQLMCCTYNELSYLYNVHYTVYNVHTLYSTRFWLKGVCHEIFDLQFFSWFEPIWAPDKQAKYFRIRFWFRRDIRSQSSKKSTPRCATHRGVKILGLDNQPNFLQLFSYMIE